MSYLKHFCNTLLSASDWLILDTETTGLHDGEICQIAVIDSHGDILLDTLIKTHQPIPPEVTLIHGINDDMVQDAPTWCDISPQLQKLLNGQLVVVYNAVYDRKMMHKSTERWQRAKVDWKTIAHFECAMEAYAEHYGDWNSYHGSYRWQKLTTAAARESVLRDDAHSALGDCLMTLGVVHALLKKYRDSHEPEKAEQ